MQDSTQPVDKSKSQLAALQAAIDAYKQTALVSPADNEKKVKAALKEAKKLLRQLRGEAPEEETPEEDAKDTSENTPEDNGIRAYATNANITPDQQRQIDLATEQFKQSVQRVDNQILAQYVQAVQNGDYAEAERILENAEESQQTKTLIFAMLTIGVILLPLYARQRLNNLMVQFGLHTVFAQTDNGQKALKQQAEKGAVSHVRTIAKDLKNSLDDAIDNEMKSPVVEAALKDKFESLHGKDGRDYMNAVRGDQDIYKYARELILKGDSRNNVIKKLQENFSEVGKRRAQVIAGNESNRIFTLSQFEADSQFLAQNKLTDKAYKRLVSNTGHPEALCRTIIERTHANPIPFKQDFIPFNKNFSFTGDDGKVKKFKADYEHLKGGTIHVNCHCRYELLIKRDDGSFLNSNTGKVMNELDFKEELHPRGHGGKFAKKKTIPTIDLGKLSSRKDFDNFVEDSYWQGTYGDYDQSTTDAVRAYQGHYYDSINMHLRSGNLDQPLGVYGEDTTFQKTVDKINSTADIALANDTTLYRGTEIPYHRNNEVGEVIHSRSFLSTSTDRSVSEDFKHKDGSMLVISAKKGTKVALPDLVTFGKRGKTMEEAEVLMPTGSSLTITRIDGDVVYATLN